jgi:NADH-quinone oxidoreductase subunit E
MISDATKARFASEVAKYPADQKQSAVMACLAIVQQELGYVSPESERVVRRLPGHGAHGGARSHHLYNMYNQRTVGQVQTERVHQPALPVA